jgi:glucose-6-phosphate 1-dehydrogenase
MILRRDRSAHEAEQIGVNPFRKTQAGHPAVQPGTIIIFGATGDLTRRKLIPALYNLTADGLLTAPIAIVGFARREHTDETFRSHLRQALEQFCGGSPNRIAGRDDFLSKVSYHRGSFDRVEDYVSLGKRLTELESRRGGPPNRLYYLATPPEAFPEILRNLKAAGLSGKEVPGGGWNRIIIEKPYGRDLKSAWMLTGAVHTGFSEDQVYRIDHYLGKETVQNILAFRLGNGIFEPLWNRTYIDQVQITVAETVGVEGRAGYFDTAGIARDMLQSHILQLFSLIAMEPPVSFEPGHIHDEKVKLLRSVRPLDPERSAGTIVRGQYSAGSVGGSEVPGYRQEPGVPPDSTTETYLALTLEIDNWRWAGVPFHIRAGKRLAKKVTEVDIIFREPPYRMFAEAGLDRFQPNVLAIKIQPEEGIALDIGCKRPGPRYQIEPVSMEFNYTTSFGIPSPEAYERLLLDSLLGDGTLFARSDEVDLSWQLVDPIMSQWESNPDVPLVFYEAGGWGPHEADLLLTRGDRRWRRL